MAKRTRYGTCGTLISHLYVLVLLFSGQLPLFRPEKIPKDVWDILELLAARKNMVNLLSIKGREITLEIPEWFDIIIHSRCAHGTKYGFLNLDRRSRFRWWSEFNKCVGRFLPDLGVGVNSQAVHLTHIIHVIRLPKFVMRHHYMSNLYQNPKFHRFILEELAIYFSMLIHEIHPNVTSQSIDRRMCREKHVLTSCTKNVRLAMIMSWNIKDIDTLILN